MIPESFADRANFLLSKFCKLCIHVAMLLTFDLTFNDCYGAYMSLQYHLCCQAVSETWGVSDTVSFTSIARFSSQDSSLC